jgi:type I restriction enzyme M protein
MPAKREQAETKPGSKRSESRSNPNGHATKPSNGAITELAPAPRSFASFSEIANFIWSIADLLRGTFKQHDYGQVILPLTVLRRLDCVLADTKEKVLAKYEGLKGGNLKNVDPILNRITGVPFHNTSKLDFAKLKNDPNHIASNLTSYIKGFSQSARDVIDRFQFADQISRLDEANLLYLVVSRFADVDLHPATVPNHMMGSAFEELIRKFAEQSNETAGEHFTPREVIRLMVDLLFVEDDDLLRKRGVVKTLFDPACGTGGMLSVAEEYLRELNPDAQLQVFGQELNDETWAICNADMMIKGQNPENIVRGNSFSQDGHVGKKFDYMLCNPPFGVEWKNVEKVVRDEYETQGHAGRFGAGLPRINDGSLLFLQHMISKMKPVAEGGGRLAIVLNGSPLFTGEAGSGESEVRRWLIENDWLEAIVAMPTDMFFNTGIATYVWVLTNRKPKQRKGRVQLINGVELYQKMRKSLGDKRNELGPKDIEKIVETFGKFVDSDISKIFDNEEFGYRRVTVERPLRLNFMASPERIERLKNESAFARLADSKKKGAAGARELEEGRELQETILAALVKLDASRLYMDRAAFENDLELLFKQQGLRVPGPVFKATISALSERDENAEVCTDAKGRPESDTELRDNENVPLKEDIHTYFDREVKPHVPDAWIDEDKTKTGYEIPFTRHFYQYKPLRPLNEIEAEIRALEEEIQGLLGQAMR